MKSGLATGIDTKGTLAGTSPAIRKGSPLTRAKPSQTVGLLPHSPNIESGAQTIKHARKWNRFAHVFNPTHPGGATFDAHAKAGMGDAPIAAQIQIPFKSLLRQAMRGDLLLQKLER